MDTAIALPVELSPQNDRDVSELAWSVATGDARHTESARKIAERWMDKGGDVYRRAGNIATGSGRAVWYRCKRADLTLESSASVIRGRWLANLSGRAALSPTLCCTGISTTGPLTVTATVI